MFDTLHELSFFSDSFLPEGRLFLSIEGDDDPGAGGDGDPDPKDPKDEKDPKADPKGDDKKDAKSMSYADAMTLVEKARTQERDKLYKKMTATEQEAETTKASLEEKTKAAEIAEAKLKELADADKTDAQKQTERIDTLGAGYEALQEELKQTKAKGEADLAASELRAFRATEIARNATLDPELHSMVVGNTQEEISASLKKTVELQARLTKSAADAHEEAEREAKKKAMPNGDATHDGAPKRLIPVLSREEMAKLPPDEYRKVLAEAKKQARERVAGASG